MGVDVTRPAYNFEPQYRVTMSMREDWAKATDGAPTVICWRTSDFVQKNETENFFPYLNVILFENITLLLRVSGSGDIFNLKFGTQKFKNMALF